METPIYSPHLSGFLFLPPCNDEVGDGDEGSNSNKNGEEIRKNEKSHFHSGKLFFFLPKVMET